jgi:hypothetical protein
MPLPPTDWSPHTLYQHFVEMFDAIEVRQRERFEAQEAARNEDRRYYDTKLQDLHDLKTHDFISVDKAIEKMSGLFRELRIADTQLFDTKLHDLREVIVHDLTAVEKRFDLSKEAVADALEAAKEAVTKAEDATERRFASVNEFRSTLSDQAAQLMPRAEAQSRFETLGSNMARIELDVRGSISAGGGKQYATAQFISTGLAIAAIVVSLGLGLLRLPPAAVPVVTSVANVDNKRLDDLAARMDSLFRQPTPTPSTPH